MEEEAARQAAANPPPAPQPGATAAVPTATAAVESGGDLDGVSDGIVPMQQHPSGPPAATSTDESEEAILQQALGLSEGRGTPDVEMTDTEGGDGDENLTEEEMIARAIEMSMHPEPESEEKEK
jgi:26S proteasome regulatory subunit N10